MTKLIAVQLFEAGMYALKPSGVYATQAQHLENCPLRTIMQFIDKA